MERKKLPLNDKGVSGEGYLVGNPEFGFGHIKSEVPDNIQKAVGYLNLELWGQVGLETEDGFLKKMKQYVGKFCKCRSDPFTFQVNFAVVARLRGNPVPVSWSPEPGPSETPSLPLSLFPGTRASWMGQSPPAMFLAQAFTWPPPPAKFSPT